MIQNRNAPGHADGNIEEDAQQQGERIPVPSRRRCETSLFRNNTLCPPNLIFQFFYICFFFPGATGHFLRFDPPPPLSSLEAPAPRQTYGSQRPSSQGLQQFGLQGSLKPKDSKMETVAEHFEEDSGPSGLDPILTAVLF